MRTDINNNMYKYYLYHRLTLLPCSVWALTRPACNKEKRAESIKAQEVKKQGGGEMWEQSEIHLAIGKKGVKTKQAKRERGGTEGRLGLSWKGTGKGVGGLAGGQGIPPPSAERWRETRRARASSVPLAEHPQGCDPPLLRGALSARHVRRIRFWNYWTAGDLARALMWLPSAGFLFAPVCHS